jgi:hypothetical protein
MNGPPLPSKGHISSEAGKQAINLNIGDHSQFYQCAATRYCQKQHIWPINMTTPKFCPEYVANQKKLNNPQASGAATENESSQETKFSEVQTESGKHIINVTSTSMPEMNPPLAFVNLKVATN